MASQLFDFRTVFFESGVFSHTGMSQERWDLRAVFRNRQQVEVDWVHWQGRWPVVERVWGLRYGPGLDQKMCQFCLSLVLHCPRRVSPSFLCCQGQDVRAQAGSTGAGSRHSSHLTWCHLSPQQWVQLLCPNPGVPLHTGPAPPPAVGLQYKAESLPPTSDNSEALCLPLPQTHKTLQLEKHSWPAFWPSAWT